MSPTIRHYVAGFLAGFGACDVVIWLSLYGQPTFFRRPAFFVLGLLLMCAGATIGSKARKKDSAEDAGSIDTFNI